MLTRWQGGTTAVIVTLLTAGLVILDLADRGMRRWWSAHALTTDTVAGLLVLLITVLVADQLVSRRQAKDRSRAVAAQAAIMAGQAARSVRAVTAALGGTGDSGSAADEVRTYMMMLLVGAPVLMDLSVTRHFLEEAQILGGEMARALTAAARTPGAVTVTDSRLEETLGRVQAAWAPLLTGLSTAERTTLTSGQTA